MLWHTLPIQVFPLRLSVLINSMTHSTFVRFLNINDMVDFHALELINPLFLFAAVASLASIKSPKYWPEYGS